MNFRKVFISLFTAGLLFVFALVALWQFLPVFLETTILPGLAVENGIGWQKGRIRRIGLTGFEAGPVIIGRDDADGITVDSIYADFTPLGLFQKRVDAIVVSGLSLNVSVRDGSLAIKGVELNRPASPSGNASERSTAGSSVAVNTIRITHAALNLDWQGRPLRIPFDLTARLAPTGEIDAKLALYPCGQKVQVAGNWFQNESKGYLSLTAHAFSLEKMKAVLKAMPDLAMEGDVDLKAGAAIQLSPFTFSDLSMRIRSSSLSAAWGGLGMAAVPGADKATPSFLLQLDQTGPQRFALKGGGLMVQSRVPLVLDTLEGDLIYDAQAVNAHVQLNTRLPAFTESPELPVALQEDLKLVTTLSAYYALAGDWRLDIVDAPGGTGLRASIAQAGGDMQVAAAKPVYKVRLKGRGAALGGTFSAASTNIRAEAPFGTGDILKLAVQGDIAADASGQPNGSAVLRVSGIKALLGKKDANMPVSIAIPDIQARAEMETPDRSAPVFKGDLYVAASTLNALESQIRLSGIEARVPWQWPVSEAKTKGLVAIGSIEWQDLDVGSLGMTVKQQPLGVAFQGEHISNLLPALQLGFSGDISFPADKGIFAEVAASLSRPATAPEIDLGRFFKEGRGIYLKGVLNGEFKGDYTTAGMEGSACVRIGAADMRLPEEDVVVKNLDVGLCFPDLPEMTTGPSQTLTFDAATVGNFKIEGGLFHFQLEPFQTLFVEKGRVGWCGGQVRLQPMRITPGIGTYETRLDCDRLNLAQILEQLSVADAVGEGTVNGTLPVSIKKGRIRFDDGFLYSTPGDGGKIHLSGADALMAGIPKGTRQFFQIDLAREALRDFDYNWAKLRVVSEAQNLRMRLQFDGKPGRILPFEYDEEFGGFVRVDADSRGSEFQGISLDVNFRVPLNDLLEYKDVLNLFE